jgi:hypothetical protein
MPRSTSSAMAASCWTPKARLEDEKFVKDGEVEKLIEKRVNAVVAEWEKRATARKLPSPPV